jgi:hypothetical protein
VAAKRGEPFLNFHSCAMAEPDEIEMRNAAHSTKPMTLSTKPQIFHVLIFLPVISTFTCSARVFSKSRVLYKADLLAR